MTLAKLLHADSIRLVRLHPGLPEDELRGELITARLNENPLFEAISYRYSDPDKQNPQKLHHQNVKYLIGDNLANALRQFRHTTNVRAIWADQLCVNQADMDERFQQLQIFGDIFSNADKVLIWLGQSNSDSVQGMILFKELVGRLYRVDKQLQQDTAKPSENALSGQDSQILKSFFEKDWFSRVWTLQEAALAKKAEVWCGDQTMSFDLFLDFHKRADNDNQGHWTSALASINTGSGGGDPTKPMRSTFQSIATVSILKRAAHISSARMLNILRPMDCTKHIDRIWSILRFFPKNLVDDLGPFREMPDASQLFCALAKMALENGEFDYLCAAGLSLQRKTYFPDGGTTAIINAADRTGVSDESQDSRPRLTLPSWVPDWTFMVRVHGLWVLNNDCEQKRGRAIYKSGGHSLDSQRVSVSNNHDCLQIRVKLLDETVGDMLDPFVIPVVPQGIRTQPDVARVLDDRLQKLDDQMQICFEMASRCDGRSKYNDIESACRATLVGSMVSDGVSSTAAGTLIRATEKQITFMYDNYEFLRRISRIFRGVDTPAEQMRALFGISQEDRLRFMTMARMDHVCDGINIKPEYLSAAFPEMCKARRFFLTETKRYMGIAPDITQPGDKICVIPGCCAPFIIRPIGQHWQLVGECYVHGIMDGEAMENEELPLVSIVFE